MTRTSLKYFYCKCNVWKKKTGYKQSEKKLLCAKTEFNAKKKEKVGHTKYIPISFDEKQLPFFCEEM